MLCEGKGQLNWDLFVIPCFSVYADGSFQFSRWGEQDREERRQEDRTFKRTALRHEEDEKKNEEEETKITGESP